MTEETLIEEETFVITLKDRDPLLVDKKRLVESSSVLRYIIEECSQTEHEMEDFTPEIVESFLDLLEDRELEKLEERDFRELHKISVVFDVSWLIDCCRKWLLEKIMNVGEEIEFYKVSFLFEECYYIHDKWNVADLMDALILELRFQATTLFVSRYLRENYDHLSDCQCKFLLHLAGSNTKALLEPIIERIEDREYLDDRTRYLLQHVNLKLCMDKDVKLYNQMAARFSKMSEISLDDCRLLLKLTTAATKEATDRRENTANETVLQDGHSDRSSVSTCVNLTQITSMITNDVISSMNIVVGCLLQVTRDETISTEEIERFVEDLEKLWQSKALQRISKQFVDIWITALKFSANGNKHQLINLLEKIRNCEKLSSNYDNIHLRGKKIQRSSMLMNILGKTPRPKRLVFKTKHPETKECKKADDCGFVIFHEGYDRVELSREAADYRDSGVHVHEEFRVEHMNYYLILTGTTQSGDTVRAPVRWWGLWWGWWKKWFDVPYGDWKEDGHLIDYNVEDYLVAKF